jgi:hypothetical protein
MTYTTDAPWFSALPTAFVLGAVLFFCDASGVRAGPFSLGSASNFGLLYEGNGGKTLSYNNSNINGNMGIGATGTFQGNGPGTINGLLEFSAANTGQFSSSGLTYNPSSGNPVYNAAIVSSALSTMNTLSHDLGLESGTSLAINVPAGGQTVNASAGALDADGNRVFTVTSVALTNGRVLTIDGSASDHVVLNVAGFNAAFNGLVQLSGGITSDQVLFNLTPSTSNLTTYNNDYTNLTGGPTLTISTSESVNPTLGVFLIPTGDFQVNHSVINGRVFGGDSKNSAFVSGANLNAPLSVPEPSSLVSFASAALLLASYRLRRRSAN